MVHLPSSAKSYVRLTLHPELHVATYTKVRQTPAESYTETFQGNSYDSKMLLSDKYEKA